MSSVQLLHQGHLPKGPTPDDLEALEVLLAQPRAPEAEELRLLLSMLVTMILTLVEEGGREGGGEREGGEERRREGGREGGGGGREGGERVTTLFQHSACGTNGLDSTIHTPPQNVFRCAFAPPLGDFPK